MSADCTDVKKSIETGQKTNKWVNFELIFRLTIWELGCLQQKSVKESNYPYEQERILMTKIKSEINNIKLDLIRLDVKTMNYIGVVLQDYKAGGNVEFNEFLVRSLLESYVSFTATAKGILESKEEKKRIKMNPPPLVNLEAIQKIKNDEQIAKFIPKSTINPEKTEAQNYVELRKNVESLYTISSKFDEVQKYLKDPYSLSADKECNLALQRLFHITGEFLKNTSMSPHLSENIRISLKDQGVPVELLTNFRDVLAHHQLFPLFKLDKQKIENWLGLFLPIKNIIDSKIVELEGDYIRGFIDKKISENPKFKNEFLKFYEDSKEGVRKLLVAVENNMSSESNKEVAELNKEKAAELYKKQVAELHSRATQMKSPYLSADQRQQGSAVAFDNTLEGFIIEKKVELYSELKKELGFQNDEEKESFFKHHEEVVKMTKLIERLKGGMPLSEFELRYLIERGEEMKGYERAEMMEPKKYKIKSDAQKEQMKDKIKSTLNKYLNDLISSQGWDVPNDLKPMNEIIEKSKATPEAKKKVSDFLKSFQSATAPLTNKDYKTYVKSLQLDQAIESKFLLVEINEGNGNVKVDFSNMPEDTSTNAEYFLEVLNTIKIDQSGVGNVAKLKNFFSAVKNPTPTNAILTANEYIYAIEQLKLQRTDAVILLSCSLDWKGKESSRLLNKYCYSELKHFYDAVLQGQMNLVSEDYLSRILKSDPEKVNRITELYDRRIKEEIEVLDRIGTPDAVESQIVNVFSLFSNKDGILNSLKPQRKSGTTVDASAEETAGTSRETEIDQLAEETPGTSEQTKQVKEYWKGYRNFVGHGDPLTSKEEQRHMSKAVIETKKHVVENLLKEIERGGIVRISTVDRILNGDELEKPVGTIRAVLCPSSSRKRRSVKGCLTWEDIQKVVDNKLENLDPDTIKINSEKLMEVLKHESDPVKTYNYLTLLVDDKSNVEGKFQPAMEGLKNRHKTYVKHLGKVEKVSGVLMHGIIAKDIVGDFLRGDYEGVAIDVGFFAGSIGMAKVAEMTALKGASFVARGSKFLGKSMQLGSPFLKRGVSAFVAYDLWNQVKEFQSGNKDALVSIVGDSIQLGVDAAEIGIEIAEGLLLIEGVSSVTGPIGMAIGAAIFVGVEVFKAVRAVDKIDSKIHLTGWEKLHEGWLAFFGQNTSEYLQKLMDEKDGNNAAVQNALTFLKTNRDIRRYVFPSYVHVNGKLVSALNSVVHLTEKVNNIKWTRSRPDDSSGINLFCKPKGDGENVPATGTYLCQNAIGVEYNEERTGNNTLINLGKGADIVKGFIESGNIFVIYQTDKTIIGGNKDDLFLFHNEGDDKLTGSLDGMGGVNTVDVGGLPKNFEVVANFQETSLEYKDLGMRSSVVTMKNIQKFRGMPGSRDRVVAACDTMFIDGMGGGEYHKMDEVEIPNSPCEYKTTIVVGANTRVNNDVTGNSTFTYIVKGEKGHPSAQINLKKGTAARNTILLKYNVEDIAAIDRPESNIITFSFVEGFHGKKDILSSKNSFNVTVSGVVQNTYLTSDSTRIVVGNNKLYALQNTDKPIDDIVNEYFGMMNKLGMIAVVHSKNEMLTIGGPYNEVINNDPSATTSHFASGDGENIFSFISGQEKLSKENLPINGSVVHFFDKVNSIDTLDFRKIKAQVKDDLGHEMKAKVTVIGDDDLKITLFFDEGGKHVILMRITLKSVLEYFWYSKVHIVLDAVFTIKKFGKEFVLVPRPLIFDAKDSSVIVISPKDVAVDTQVTVAKKLGNHVLVRQGNSLIITNSLSLGTHKEPLVTVMVDQFYNETFKSKMKTLNFNFYDKTISLKKEIRRIEYARHLVELQQLARAEYSTTLSAAIGRTQVLFEAINQDRIEEAKKIIDRDGVFSSKGVWMDPMAYAADKGVLEIVKYLFVKGADILGTDGSGHTPVYYAVRNNHTNVTDFLLSKLFAAGDAGIMALTAELPVVKCLTEIEGGKYVTLIKQMNSTLLHYAAMNGNMDVVKYLFEDAQDLKGDFNVTDENKKTPMEYAVENRNFDVVNYFSSVMEKRGTTPLCFYSQLGKLEMVRYLIGEKGADVYEKDKSGRTPLHCAIQHKRTHVIPYLMKVIAKDTDGQLLAYPSITGDVSVAPYLLAEGAPVNSWNAFGKTPLHYAAIHCNHDMMTMLIAQCANVMTKDKFGFTPQHYISINSDPTCNKTLFSALEATYKPCVPKISVNRVTNGSRSKRDDHAASKTPLHAAAQQKQLELVKNLIEYGYDPNVKDQFGCTPLHYAAANGDMSVVKYLVEHGGDVLAKDNNEYTPVMLGQGDPRIQDYLLEKVTGRKQHHLEHQEGLWSSLNSTLYGGLRGNTNTTSIQENSYGVLSWIKSSISSFFSPKLEETQKPSFSLNSSQIDANSTLLLLDLMIRKVTGQKYTAATTVDPIESHIEIQGYALNVVETFEDVLNATALELNIPASSIDFDPLAVQSAVIRLRRYGATFEIPKLLFSFAEKSCLDLGRVTEFLQHFRINLEQVLNERNGLLLPKIDQISYPMFSSKYGVVVRATETDFF